MIKELKQKPIDSTESLQYLTYNDPNEFNRIKTNKLRICDYTSLINYHLTDLDMSWGSILIWSKKQKSYLSLYEWHTWNVDDDGNIYDDFKSLSKANNSLNLKNITEYKHNVKVIDGSNYSFNLNYPRHHLEKRITKVFKKSFPKPKIIYVENYASYPIEFLSKYQNDEELKLTVERYGFPFIELNWDLMEMRWERMEKEEVSKDIQTTNNLRCAA